MMKANQQSEIAIIGLGCRFPQGETPEEFWHLLSNGIDAVTEVPSDRWNVDQLYEQQPATPGKMSTRWGGFLSQVDGFDPLFFNISLKEAERIDPQQRLFLEVAWEALEHAGLATDKLAGTATGVFAAMAVVNYDQLLYKNVADLKQISAYDGIGTTLSLAASRLSYLLDLKGPSLAIETACSSSLVATHLACQSLRTGESNLCIVGGVNLILTPELNIVFSQAQMMSPEGRCKTFDADANGYVRGEGCGVVILKRLADAIADRDNILAVIKGSAIAQDGLSNGITAPNGPIQQAVIRQALDNAGVKAAQVSYVEAHGTGTPLGDPIEVKSLRKVLMSGRPLDRPCHIGSVKTNIGHLESAAGIAGLIKVVLALQHREIPPNLHFKQLNPYIRLEKTPITIPTEKQPWSVESTRIAGISSFGFGGTNAHVVLEEAAIPATQSNEKLERPLQVLTLSAKSDRALAQLAQRYSSFLKSQSASLADICFTANTGRTHFEHRLVAISKTKTELQQSLKAFATGQETATVTTNCLSVGKPPQIAFLFTGQGSQYAGMGRELYETQPTFRQALNRCAEILTAYLDRPLLEIIYPESATGQIDKTQYTQPALFALEYALAQLWQSWGVRPNLMMGHSVGEYVAACLAGVFSLEDGLKLIAERGRLMQSLPADGAMIALLTEPKRAIAAIKTESEVEIAAFNGTENVVISGKASAVRRVAYKLEAEGVKTKTLQVSHGFHSKLMEPILSDFARVAREVTYSTPKIDLISNLTGELATAEIATPQYWCQHVRHPVQFAVGMATLSQLNCPILLEVGSKPILLGMSSRCLEDSSKYTFLPSLRPRIPDWQQILASLGQLYLQGIKIDWQGFERDYPQRRRVVLPTYPFQRARYWIDNRRPQANSSANWTALFSLLDRGDTKPICDRRKESATLSPAESEFLPKLLQLIVKEHQQEKIPVEVNGKVNANPTAENEQSAIVDHDCQSVRQLEQLLATPPKHRRQLLQSQLGQLLAKVVKISYDQIDWQLRLSSLGLDSLMAADLRRRIEQQFDIAIPVEFLAELNLEQFLTQMLVSIEQQHQQLDSVTQADKILAQQKQSDLWLLVPQPKPQASLRLFCLPYAGAGASMFTSWANKLAPEIELCALQLPGRESRAAETPFTRIKPLVQTLVPLLQPYLDLPFAFFGHSMGATLSFELIRELRNQNQPLPVHLFISGFSAPQLPDLKPPIHRLPDSKFEVLATALKKYFLTMDLKFDLETIDRFFSNVKINGRYFTFPLDSFYDPPGVAEVANAAIIQCLNVIENTVTDLLCKAAIAPQDISQLTATTLIAATPGLDARLINRIPFSPEIKRMALTGVGCMGGAFGLARVADYLQGHPTESSVLFAINPHRVYGKVRYKEI